MDKSYQYTSFKNSQEILLEKEQKIIIELIQKHKPSIKILSCVQTQQHKPYQLDLKREPCQINSIIFNGYDQSKDKQISMKVFFMDGEQKENQVNYMHFFINNHLRKLTRKDLVIQFYDYFTLIHDDQPYIVFEMEQVSQQLSLYLLNQESNNQEKVDYVLNLIEGPIRYIYDRIRLQQVSIKEEIFPSQDLLRRFSNYFFILLDNHNQRASIKFDSLNPDLFPNDIDISTKVQDNQDDSDDDKNIAEDDTQKNEQQQFITDPNQKSYIFEDIQITIPIKEAIQFIEKTNEQIFVFHHKSLLIQIFDSQKYNDFELLDYNELSIEFGTNKIENNNNFIIRLEKFTTQREAEIALNFLINCDGKNKGIFLPINFTKILNIKENFYVLIEEQRLRRYPFIQYAMNMEGDDQQNNLLIQSANFENNEGNSNKGNKMVVTMSLHYILHNMKIFFSMSDFIPHNNYMIVQLLFLTLQLRNRQEIDLNSNDIFINIQYYETSKDLILTNIYIRKNINRKILFDNQSLEHKTEEDKLLIQDEILLKNIKSSIIKFSVLCKEILGSIMKISNFPSHIQNKFSQRVQEIINQVLKCKEIYYVREIKKSQNYKVLKQLKDMIVLQQLKTKHLFNKKHFELFRLRENTMNIDIDTYMMDCTQFTIHILKYFKKVQIQLYDQTILERLIQFENLNERVYHLTIQLPSSIYLSSQNCEFLIQFLLNFSSLKSLSLKLNIEGELQLQKLQKLQQLSSLNIEINEDNSQEFYAYWSTQSNLNNLFRCKKNFKSVMLKVSNEEKENKTLDDYWKQFQKIQQYLSSLQNNDSSKLDDINLIIKQLPLFSLIRQQGVQDITKIKQINSLQIFIQNKLSQNAIDKQFANSLLQLQTDYPLIQFEAQNSEYLYELCKISLKDTLNPNFNQLQLTLELGNKIKLKKGNLLKTKCNKSATETWNQLNDNLLKSWWKSELESYLLQKEGISYDNQHCFHRNYLSQTLQQFQGQQLLQTVYLRFTICNSVVDQLRDNKSLFDFNSNHKNVALTLQYILDKERCSEQNKKEIINLFSDNLRNNKRITSLTLITSEISQPSKITSFKHMQRLVVIKKYQLIQGLNQLYKIN